VQPKPLQAPHPPIFGATGSDDGHQLMGELGLGVCSFSVASPPEDVKRRLDIYRKAVRSCTKPLGRFVNDQAAAFTMVNCAPTPEESYEVSRESYVWYVKRSVELITTVATWLEEMKRELGTYQYLEGAKEIVKSGTHDIVNFDYLKDSNAVIVGDPDEVVERCRAYEAAGVDLLLCLLNPHAVPHEKCMQSIELIGRHVIPEFQSR
jgi:alkanesulfonate monooxygenase SsuD/methylene tetrahydromethanopterin reductase-like flavin-dependent oxidoreductase (luciferase family)